MVLVAALSVVPPRSSCIARAGASAALGGGEPGSHAVLGVAVAPLRWRGVLISGALSGLAGAYLAVEVVNNWREGQTLGLGFIALAALILSNWNPVRLMGAAFLFGFAQAIPAGSTISRSSSSCLSSSSG